MLFRSSKECHEECYEALKCLMILDVVEGKENMKNICMSTKGLYKEREEYRKLLKNFSKPKKKHMHVGGSTLRCTRKVLFFATQSVSPFDTVSTK